jgi:hypothetical protein
MNSYSTTAQIFVFLAIVASCGHLFAECHPPPAYEARLQQLRTEAEGFPLAHMEGLAYLELKCWPEARAAFTAALAKAKTQPGDDGLSRVAWAEALLDLTSGYEAWSSGDLNLARAIFLRRSDEVNPSDVSSLANFALAELLLQSPDDAVWSRLELNLQILDGRGFWQARRYLLIYGLTPSNCKERIPLLEKRLKGPSAVQDTLANQILLADVLRLCDRGAEAALLVHDIDRDVGRKAISPDLRAQYLRTCAAIASQQSRSGDQDAQKQYSIFASALGALYAEN